VFKEPISTFLATSGVLAIVLGLALQNTLGNVFSGLAINIERPFRAGDWITVGDNASGQVTEVNWRATRIRTWSNDTMVIPNSVISMAAVTNHSRPRGPHDCVIRLNVDLSVTPSHVIEVLNTTARASPDISAGSIPRAYAREFSDSLVTYELAFAIDSFALTPDVKSKMLLRVADAFQEKSMRIGAQPMDVRITKGADIAVVKAIRRDRKVIVPKSS
jgi:small-conductance mechanosensitive channel